MCVYIVSDNFYCLLVEMFLFGSPHRPPPPPPPGGQQKGKKKKFKPIIELKSIKGVLYYKLGNLIVKNFHIHLPSANYILRKIYRFQLTQLIKFIIAK